jgi:uncharacterized membrane protein
MHSRYYLLLVGLAVTPHLGCQSPRYIDRGATAGALTGAIAGAAIGEHNDRPLAGAAIGTAIGALTGSAIGDSMDREVDRRAAQASFAAGALTTSDVVEMSASGLSDDVIVRQIRRDGLRQSPTKEDLVQLTRAGVSDRVIEELQTTNAGQYGRTGYAPPRATVVEHYYSGPRFRAQWHHGHHAPPGCYW